MLLLTDPVQFSSFDETPPETRKQVKMKNNRSVDHSHYWQTTVILLELIYIRLLCDIVLLGNGVGHIFLPLFRNTHTLRSAMVLIGTK